MADQTLRQLERRFRETGAPEDEVRWLLARVRGGALDPERLCLAAYVDHAPARQALASAREDPRLAGLRLDGALQRANQRFARNPGYAIELDVSVFHDPYALLGEDACTAWLLRLERWGQEACVRAALAGAGGPILRGWSRTGMGEALAAAVEQLRRWLLGDRGLVAAEALRGVAPREFVFSPVGLQPEELPAALRLGLADSRSEGRTLGAVIGLPAQALASALSAAVRLGLASEDELRGAIRRDVAAWALGYRDPAAAG